MTISTESALSLDVVKWRANFEKTCTNAVTECSASTLPHKYLQVIPNEGPFNDSTHNHERCTSLFFPLEIRRRCCRNATADRTHFVALNVWTKSGFDSKLTRCIGKRRGTVYNNWIVESIVVCQDTTPSLNLVRLT